ncbi:hypothetical protein MKX01_041069 [Papaver californicum]|nr:hypothetical protein MKX01_041069 [Papaver californicum]
MVMTQEIELAEIKVESPRHISKPSVKKLTLIPLIFLIFFEVSGGPYGEEPSIKAAGPLFALLGFLIFPFIWSMPEALITAELGTAYPGNGGYVIWAYEAFGPFWGSMMGSLKFLSGSLNNVAYPVMMHPRCRLIICTTTILLSFVNYMGLSVVGWFVVGLGLVSLVPFIIMFGMTIPKIQWRRLLSFGKNRNNFKLNDWPTFFNTLFWNLNFWDNATLFSAGIITCVGYLIPLVEIAGALEFDQDKWVKIGSVLSSIRLFEAQLSSSFFQTEGMTNLKFLPGLFARRSKWFNTPWAGILMSCAISFGITFLPFDNIISAANFSYGLGILLEFSAFIRLRLKHPDLVRPYKVPMSVPFLCIMCLIPAGFVVYVMVIMVMDKIVVFYISVGLTAIAILNYFLMNYCKC